MRVLFLAPPTPLIAVSAAMLARSAWEAARPMPDTAAARTWVPFGRLADRRLPFHCVDVPLMSYRTHPKQLSATRLPLLGEALSSRTEARVNLCVAPRLACAALHTR